jgi:hypothetical protein
MYGFLGMFHAFLFLTGTAKYKSRSGFSYPLEVADCSDPSNQYEKIRIDLERMKTEFGATFVRPYGVECRQVSIWENLVKACIDLGMALIVQVWWGFQDDVSCTPSSLEAILC